MKRKYLYFFCLAAISFGGYLWFADTTAPSPCAQAACESGSFCQTLDCRESCVNGTIYEIQSCTAKAYQCTTLSYSTKIINGQTYFLSNEKMNWWNAVRFCEALPNNKKSVNLAALGCTDTLGSAGCAESTLRKALVVAGWTNWVWTSSPYGIQSDYSCWAHPVSLSDGVVSYAYRNNLYYALCE